LRNRGISDEERERLPPGQHLVRDFPVLHAAGTPYRQAPSDWDFRVTGLVDTPLRWTIQELRAQPITSVTCDIHCVTSWSKLDTRWQGVGLDALLDAVEHDSPYVLAFCDGGYTTNLAIEDVTGGRAWIAFGYDGDPLEPEHGGPARLLVPHLYFWKSAKWVRGLELRDDDEPGFWEGYGYHNHGDPWREQRYAGD